MKTPKPPKGYRVLRVGEIIKQDDRSWPKQIERQTNSETFLTYFGVVGLPVMSCDGNWYFRKLKPKKGRKK